MTKAIKPFLGVPAHRKFRGFLALLRFDNWPALILNRLFYSRIGATIYVLEGAEVLIDHSGHDENGTRAALVNGMYRDLLSDITRTTPITVMDLGANGGGFLLLLSYLGYSIDTICAVEMNRFTFSRLQFNIINNISARRMFLVNAAVTAQSGVDSFYFYRKGCTSDSIYGTSDRGDLFPTRTETIDNLIHQHFGDQRINVCKIDIEGAEFEVFGEGLSDRMRQVDNLIIEIHDGGSRRDALFKRLRDYGLVAVAQSREEHKVYLLRRSVTGN